MWIGVPKDASVCLRCQVLINHPLRRQVPNWLPQLRPITRAQSTAAAIVEDVEENVEEVQGKQGFSKKSKKEHRRVWLPRVARLGVSSLGKPAEVLVLEDRDRHVPSAAEDNAERSKASQSQILDALQAENQPLSSESVQQILDQMGDTYRQHSALSPEQQIELRKKVGDGFTLKQLRSYCHRKYRLKLSHPATPPASNNEVQEPSIRAPELAEAERNDAALAKKFFNLGKPSLADYIIRHIWAIAGLAEEWTRQHIPITTEKIRYILSHKQSLLKEYEEQFNVQIDVSNKNGRMYVSGKPEHVHLARVAVESLCEEITSSRARSLMNGKDLGSIATPSFLHELARTFDVMISWASELDNKVTTEEDWLSICYHKPQDRQNAFLAERAILLAEHDSPLAKQVGSRQSKISMWVQHSDDPKPDLLPHHAPERSTSLDRQRSWSRWAFPQKPIHKGHIDRGSKVSVTYQLLQYLAHINKQSKSITRALTGHLDEFFEEMQAKRQHSVRRRINSADIQEDIFAHFGQVLFPQGETPFARAFNSVQKIKNSVICKAKNPPSTLESTDLPALPTFLRSLSPYEENKNAAHGTEDHSHTRKYRIQYRPVTPRLSFGLDTPTIEIDVCRTGDPGSAVNNRVMNVWAILSEQAHKVLTPDFAVDLLFGRRLKLLLNRSCDGGGAHLEPTKWLEEFQAQIENLDSDQFPLFLNIDLPRWRRKLSKITKSAAGHKSTEAPADVFGEAGGPAPGNSGFERQFLSPRTEYMLKSCEVVHVTSFKAKQLCLEHLMVEDTNSDDRRVVLRLARQRLFDDDLNQLAIPVLFDRAFKIAAHLSDPRLVTNPKECTLFATSSHKTKT
jgi:Mitochondrial inner-membrane-bound regulator